MVRALFLSAVISGLFVPASAEAITPCEMIDRAQAWVDARVPYSQSSYYTNGNGTYRQDCSGYVSMAWALNTSYTTTTLPGVANRISYGELDAGDALNDFMVHVVLFKEWIEPGVSFRVYAEPRTGTTAQIQNWTVDYALRNGYTPYRFHGRTGSFGECSCQQTCGSVGCGCVAGECSGGFCPGTGCTAAQEAECGGFGCGCVDGGCSGGFCAGSGCTAKEINDCATFGSGCVDHVCNGGTAPGTGCTAKEMNDCGSVGCTCVDHQCSGGVACTAKGNGCTFKEVTACNDAGGTCTDHVCTVPVEVDGGVVDEELVLDNTQALTSPKGDSPGAQPDSDLDGPATVQGSCAVAQGSSSSSSTPRAAWALLVIAWFLGSRRRRRP